jgi:hypothetical protein
MCRNGDGTILLLIPGGEIVKPVPPVIDCYSGKNMYKVRQGSGGQLQIHFGILAAESINLLAKW